MINNFTDILAVYSFNLKKEPQKAIYFYSQTKVTNRCKIYIRLYLKELDMYFLKNNCNLSLKD